MPSTEKNIIISVWSVDEGCVVSVDFRDITLNDGSIIPLARLFRRHYDAHQRVTSTDVISFDAKDILNLVKHCLNNGLITQNDLTSLSQQKSPTGDGRWL